MKAILIALILATAVLCDPPKYYELEGYTFEKFVNDFEKTYKSDEDMLAHKEAFYAKLAEIKAFNNDSTQTYKKGVNSNTDAIGTIKPVNMGFDKSMLKTTKNLFRNLKTAAPIDVSELPKSVDWRTKGVVSPVKDQGHCGSCWAFASTACIESHAAINSNGQIKTLSTQQLVSCSVNPFQCGGTGGCEGSIAELAFNYVQLYGLTSEYKYPYNSYFSGETNECFFDRKTTTPEVALDGYAKLPANSYADLLNAVATIGPVAVAVDASTWHEYESGVFNGCSYTESINVNHVVVVEGYGTDAALGDYWLIRNSWGTRFGENGYIRLARDAEVTLCGTDKTPLNGQACAGQDVPTKVCGQCAVLYDGSYPLNARVVG